jgi:sec-independent protein translocase protein TatC
MAESESPFLDFLVREGDELRRRLIWCLAVFLLVSCLLIGLPSFSDSYALRLMSWLQTQLLPPGLKLVFLDPLEPMAVAIKFSMLLSLVISLPVVSWHVVAFTAPAFSPGMRGYYMRFTFLALLFLLAGLTLTGVFVLPMTLKMLLDYGLAAGGTPLLTFNRFYMFSGLVLIAFALPFETPLIMGFLQRFNLVPVEQFKKWRFKAWGGFIILSQFVTPDPLVTPLIFSIACILLYELGIRMGKWL